MKIFALFVLGGALSLTACGGSHSGSTPASPPEPKKADKSPTPSTAATATSTPAASHSSPSGSPFNKGKAYLRARNYKAAEAEFKRSIANGDEVAPSYFGLATSAGHLRDYATAYRAAKEAEKREPKSPNYLYGAAYEGLYAKDYRGAVLYATSYIKLEPKDPNGYHLRFLAYGSLLLHKQQVADAEMVVHLKPAATAWNDLGIALGNDSKLKTSIQSFTEAIRLKPRVAAFYMNRAIVENLSKRSDMALKDLEKARTVARDPATRKTIDVAIKNLKSKRHP